MFELIVLTCSLALKPDQCTVKSATQVVTSQATFANAAACEENAQRMRRLQPTTSAKERIKIVCSEKTN
jgi:hypothetical protein